MVFAWTIQAYATEISEQEAYQVAQQFFATGKKQAKSAAATSQSLQLVHSSTSYYVFNRAGNNGFVIVATDDRFNSQVLGYSDEGSFNATNIPNGMKYWLDEYDRALKWIEESGYGLDEEANQVVAPKRSAARSTRTDIAPMVTTLWGQDAPYSDLCPNQYPTGCVATALAQIIRYKQFPSAANGHTYTYTSMADSYSSNSNAPEVAQLMADIGSAVGMSYAASESAATNINALRGMISDFGFDKSASLLQRNFYDNSEWINILYNELTNVGPFFYAGKHSNGGHAFVCDGYENRSGADYFHFNFGWNGSYNGYFLLDAINPTGSGTGGGSGTYNNDQEALINLIPNASSTNYSKLLYNTTNFGVSSTSQTTSSTATFTGTFVNYSAVDATFTTGLKVIDSDNNITWIEGSSLSSLSSYGAGVNSFTVNLSGFPKTDGDYSVFPAYKDENNEWQLIHTWNISTTSGRYTPYLNANVSGSNITFSVPALDATIKPTSPSFIEALAREEVTVNYTITNNTKTTYSKEFHVSILTTDNKVVNGYTFGAQTIMLSPGDSIDLEVILTMPNVTSTPTSYNYKYNAFVDGVELPSSNRRYLMVSPNSGTVNYTVNFNTAPINGTFKIKNGDTELTSGNKVPENTVLTVETNPADGFMVDQIFVNGTALNSGATTFTVTGTSNIEVTFKERMQRTITLANVVGNGSLSVTANGTPLNAGENQISDGTQLTINATANANNALVLITVDGINVANGHTFTVSQNSTIAARFRTTVSTIYLSDMDGVSTKIPSGWSEQTTKANQTISGATPLRLNNVPYTKGVGTHANSTAYIQLNGATAFSAVTGIDSEIVEGFGNFGHEDYANATYKVEGFLFNGDSVVLQTGPIRYLENRTATIGDINLTDLSNYKYLKLEHKGVNENWNCHTDWADAVFVYNGTIPALISRNEMDFSTTPTPVNYMVTLVQPEEHGTFSLQYGTNTITDNQEFAQGTTLTVVPNPADGYELDKVIVNDVEQEGLTFVVQRATTVTVTFKEITTEPTPEVGYVIPTGGKAGGESYLERIYSTDANINIDKNWASNPDELYQLVDEAITVVRGSSFTLNLNAHKAGEASTIQPYQDLRYTQAYIYTDWDRDYAFTQDGATIGVHSPQSGANPNNVLANYHTVLEISKQFTVPADAPLGESRIRVIYNSAWATLNNDANSTNIDGGMAYDIRVNVIDIPTYPVTLVGATGTHGSFQVKNDGVAITSGDEIAEGTVLSVEVTTYDGYELDEILVNDVALGEGVTTFTVNGATTVEVTFKEEEVATYSVTVTTDTGVESYKLYNGTTAISNTQLSAIESGSVLTLQEVEFNEGYEISSVTWNGTVVEPTTEGTHTVYTFPALEANATLNITTQKIKHTVTINQPTAGGTISVTQGNSPIGTKVEHGTVLTITPSAENGYELSEVLVNGSPITPSGTSGGYTHTVIGATTITATFTATSTSTNYTVTLVGTTSTHGSFQVKNNGVAIASGDAIAEGTVLSVEVTTYDGYELDEILVNNVALESGVTTFTVNGATTVEVTFKEIEDTPSGVDPMNSAAYCKVTATNTYGKGSTPEKYLDSFSITGGIENFTLSGYSQAAGRSIYQDLTTTNTLKVEAGQNLTLTTHWISTGAMHGYLYVDWNKDGSFSDNVTSGDFAPFNCSATGVPVAGSEVVSYTYLHTSNNSSGQGYNSNGETGQQSAQHFSLHNGNATWPTIKIPAGTPAGKYRMRFHIAWTRFDPCVVNDATPSETDGVELIDFILQVGTVSHTVTLENTNSIGGAFKVKNGDVTITNGEEILAGTTLTVIADPAEGYKLGQILINDVALGTAITTFTVDEATTVRVTFEEETALNYCNEYSGNISHKERKLNSLTLNGSFTISNIQESTSSPIYQNKVAEEFVVEAGTTVSTSVDWDGEWMHGYLYIDYNKDGEFSDNATGSYAPFNIGTTGIPAANSELVTYTYYGLNDGTQQKGYDSAGNEHSGTNSNRHESLMNGGNIPDFTIPANLPAGNYRARFVVAWNSIDPCGYSGIGTDGGCILDFTLKITKNHTISVAVAEGHGFRGTAYIEEEDITEASVVHGESITITAKEFSFYENGGYRFYKFLGWSLNGTLIQNADYEPDENDGTIIRYTLPAVMTDAHYEANFNTATSVNEIDGAIVLYYSNGKVYTNIEGVIEIYDLTGNLVKRSEVAPVDVTGLANGAYIVRVNGKILKFVK